MRDAGFVIETTVQCPPLANLGEVDAVDDLLDLGEIDPLNYPASPRLLVQRIFANAENITDVIFHWIDSDFENTIQPLK